MDLFNKCHFALLNEIREKNIYPYFHVLQSRQAPVVQMEGKRMIMLGSNNYLGYTENEEIIEAAKQAIDKYGTGVSGSRFLNGTLDIHLQLEEELAKFMGYEAAMTCSTGFQTNLAIISAICGKDDYILNDKENHASIYDACKLSLAKMLRFRHSDMADLEAKFLRGAKRRKLVRHRVRGAERRKERRRGFDVAVDALEPRRLEF